MRDAVLLGFVLFFHIDVLHMSASSAALYYDNMPLFLHIVKYSLGDGGEVGQRIFMRGDI